MILPLSVIKLTSYSAIIEIVEICSSGGLEMIEIYYAEDDENIAQSVKAFLEDQGYRVSVFSTIAEAKQALKQSLPTMVLVDWNMPGGNGSALCQWIRSNWKELPVIFIAVRGGTRDIVSGFQSGADDCVVKPFELDVLLSIARALNCSIDFLLDNVQNESDAYLFALHRVADFIQAEIQIASID